MKFEFYQLLQRPRFFYSLILLLLGSIVICFLLFVFLFLIMESSGGMIGETASLLSSLCGIIDRHEGLSLGCTWQECQIHLAIDLHRGLHGACSKQLIKEPDDGALQRASAAFRTTCI